MVKYFCDEAWRKLIDYSGNKDGEINNFEIEKFFEIADKDKSGSLDQNEIMLALQEVVGEDVATSVVAKQMLSLADKDQDGKVSRDELKEIMINALEEHK